MSRATVGVAKANIGRKATVDSTCVCIRFFAETSAEMGKLPIW